MIIFPCGQCAHSRQATSRLCRHRTRLLILQSQAPHPLVGNEKDSCALMLPTDPFALSLLPPFMNISCMNSLLSLHGMFALLLNHLPWFPSVCQTVFKHILKHIWLLERANTRRLVVHAWLLRCAGTCTHTLHSLYRGMNKDAHAQLVCRPSLCADTCIHAISS
jgi:hypothetical protein